MRALLVDYLTGYSHGSPLADNKAGHACKEKSLKNHGSQLFESCLGNPLKTTRLLLYSSL
jgi:hypothetical protein